jgi:hypothetical protein
MASVYISDSSTWDEVAISGKALNFSSAFRGRVYNDQFMTINGFTSGAYSNYYCNINYGFAGVPSGETITGIKVSVYRYGSNFKDYSLKLVKGGTIQGNDKADTSTNFPGSATLKDYGGDGDLWGLTLTDTDVKASNFGVAFAVQQTASGYNECYLDYMGITVYYGSGGGGSSYPPGHAFNNGSGYSGNRRAFVAGGLNLGGF